MTCSTSQDELGWMTYERYQEETIQELKNDLTDRANRVISRLVS